MALPRLLPARRSVRLVGGTCALALAGGVLGLMADPASAANACTTDDNAVVCLDINPNASRQTYFVHVGVEVHMSRQEAQAYVDQGRPFTVTMRGADPAFDDALFTVPNSAISATDEFGLSADFDVAVGRFALNEDDSFFDDRDEVYADIDLFDARTGQTVSYESAQIKQKF
jgi:hypothetical protein